MWVKVLGPVEVGVEDVRLRLPKKPLALLTACVLENGRPLPIGRLVAAIWDEFPPASAAGLVKTYVSDLRRMLHQPARPQVIRTVAPGYAVHLDPGQLDL